MLLLTSWLSRRASQERPLVAITQKGGCVELVSGRLVRFCASGPPDASAEGSAP
jgi:hypothetical protein